MQAEVWYYDSGSAPLSSLQWSIQETGTKNSTQHTQTQIHVKFKENCVCSIRYVYRFYLKLSDFAFR